MAQQEGDPQEVVAHRRLVRVDGKPEADNEHGVGEHRANVTDGNDGEESIDRAFLHGWPAEHEDVHDVSEGAEHADEDAHVAVHLVVQAVQEGGGGGQ